MLVQEVGGGRSESAFVAARAATGRASRCWGGQPKGSWQQTPARCKLRKWGVCGCSGCRAPRFGQGYKLACHLHLVLVLALSGDTFSVGLLWRRLLRRLLLQLPAAALRLLSSLEPVHGRHCDAFILPLTTFSAHVAVFLFFSGNGFVHPFLFSPFSSPSTSTRSFLVHAPASAKVVLLAAPLASNCRPTTAFLSFVRALPSPRYYDSRNCALTVVWGGNMRVKKKWTAKKQGLLDKQCESTQNRR